MTSTVHEAGNRLVLDPTKTRVALDGGKPIVITDFFFALLSILINTDRPLPIDEIRTRLGRRGFKRARTSAYAGISELKSELLSRLGIVDWCVGVHGEGYHIVQPPREDQGEEGLEPTLPEVPEAIEDASTPPIVRKSGKPKFFAQLLDADQPLCMWPIGHPGDKDFHFCGDPPMRGKPYCSKHGSPALAVEKPIDIRGIVPDRGQRVPYRFSRT